MLAIVDYGVGNLRSVKNMLRKVQVEAEITSDEEAIRAADKLILPGVGNFGAGMEKLRASGLVPALDWFALEAKKPVLGICLGAQILGNRSEEGEGDGLGWIDMECTRFPESSEYRVPHMRWNGVYPVVDTPLLASLNEESRFYFVHSYFMKCKNESDVLATSNHGFSYTCAVHRDNIYGVQFHPEKSLKHGMAVLKAFAEIN